MSILETTPITLDMDYIKKELNMSKFIELTLAENKRKTMILKDMVKEVEQNATESIITTLENRVIYVKETYEQVKEMLG